MRGRIQYELARRHGDELEVFVKEQTGSSQNPIVSTVEVAKEFEMNEEEVVERLRESERVMGREVGESVWVWW